MARRGTGRRKVAIRKIENQSSLEVTFSKRRNGIFKKAFELSLLCGCHVGIVIFSMTQKLFAFGNPSAEAVFDRFCNGDPDYSMYFLQLMEDQNSNELIRMNQQIADYENFIKAEKTHGGDLNELPNDSRDKKWWLTSPEEMTREEAEEMLAKIEEFKVSLDDSSSSLQNDGDSYTDDGAASFARSPSPLPPLDDFFARSRPFDPQMAINYLSWKFQG